MVHPTGVVALPTMLSPAPGVAAPAVPTFGWLPPSPLPARFMYRLWVNNESGGSPLWCVWTIPAEVTRVVYNQDGRAQMLLLPAGEYVVNLSVQDDAGNNANRPVHFTVAP